MTPLPIEDQDIQDALDKAIKVKNAPPKQDGKELDRREVRLAYEKAEIHYKSGAISGYGQIKFRFNLPSGKKRRSSLEKSIRALVGDFTAFTESDDDVDKAVSCFMKDYDKSLRFSRYHPILPVGHTMVDLFGSTGKVRMRSAYIELKGATITINQLRDMKAYLEHIRKVS